MQKYWRNLNVDLMMVLYEKLIVKKGYYVS